MARALYSVRGPCTDFMCAYHGPLDGVSARARRSLTPGAALWRANSTGCGREESSGARGRASGRLCRPGWRPSGHHHWMPQPRISRFYHPSSRFSARARFLIFLLPSYRVRYFFVRFGITVRSDGKNVINGIRSQTVEDVSSSGGQWRR